MDPLIGEEPIGTIVSELNLMSSLPSYRQQLCVGSDLVVQTGPIVDKSFLMTCAQLTGRVVDRALAL